MLAASSVRTDKLATIGMQEAPLHVAIVSTQAGWHGGEQQAALLAEGILRRGYRCSILCREQGEFARRMADDGFDVFPFPRRGRTPAGLVRIRSLLKQLRPDVIHANDPHALTATGLAGLGLSIPLRVVARRVDFPVRSKGRYRRFADGIICVSSAVANVCAASGMREAGLQVVHDGVDPTFAESGQRQLGRKSLQLSDDQPLLLTVAKLTDHKGHKYLLDAVPRVLNQHPKAIVAFAGDGELRDKLAAQSVELGIQDNVRFLGYRNDVPDLLAAADVVVQPSHMEGLCSSLIDAMLAECPIVATRAGGIPDLLESFADEPAVAWLVEPKSPDALAAGIRSALADKDEASRRAESAKLRASRCFTADRMVESTLSAYQRIAEQSTRIHVQRVIARLTAMTEHKYRSAA